MQRSRFITEKKVKPREPRPPREKPSSERPKMSCPKARGGSLYCPLEGAPNVWVPARSLPRKGQSELGPGCLGTVAVCFLGQPIPSVRLQACARHSVPARASASPPLSIRTGLHSCSWLRVPAAAIVRYTLEQLLTETTARGTARRAATSPHRLLPAPAHTSPGICARRKGTEAAAGKAASG